jgi:hypothetical protein
MNAQKESTKRIIDVSHPDESTPSQTSKAIIVKNGPILKDPMVVEKNDQSDIKSPLTGKSSLRNKLQPTAEQDKTQETAEDTKPVIEAKPVEAEAKPEVEEKKPEPEAKTEAPAEASPESDSITDTPLNRPGDSVNDATNDKDDTEDKEAAARETALQKLTESREYFLPINSVEKLRSKRVAILGTALSILLIVVWIDIALDAGLLTLGSVHSVTHFFSS